MILRRFRHIAGLTIFFALVGVGGWILAHPYAIPDWLRLRGYTPPRVVNDLAGDTTMTDTARHLFFINRPQVENKTTFAKACPQASEQTIVIGCYIGGQRGIHILLVEDDRLAGIEQVTAAHEMLHAAYERLSSSERARVDAMLQDYADNGLKDERIRGVLKGYETSEPGQQHNEMHSIFGTEVTQLPSELESYYARYFIDRGRVAGYAAKYQAAFTSRQSTVRNYDDQLAKLGSQIKQNTATLEQQDRQIGNRRQELESYRASGSIEAYNAGVEPFNGLIARYNSLLGETRQLIDRYNAIVAQRNEIASQTEELQQAISTQSLPSQQ